MNRLARGFAHWPLGQLVLARLREFTREPEAVFWVYGFPMVMIVALGIAFRGRPVEQVSVDVVDGPGASEIAAALGNRQDVLLRITPEADARRRLRVGKTQLVLVGKEPVRERLEYLFDPTRSESMLARARVDDILQRSAGRVDPLAPRDVLLEEPGGRYIDFLVPGLLGLGLMGGGLWGVGFVTVDMRIKKLLKRFLATPMRKRDFLAAILISRLLFMIPEMLFVLLFARLFFGVVVQGSLLAVGWILLLGALAFSGVGLLVASRAKTVEAVSGLMNLVMLPMWICSGIFFSYERFPESWHPAIRVLPLTALLDALRGVMMEGAPLLAVFTPLLVLAAWTAGSFALALRLFRWN